MVVGESVSRYGGLRRVCVAQNKVSSCRPCISEHVGLVVSHDNGAGGKAECFHGADYRYIPVSRGMGSVLYK